MINTSSISGNQNQIITIDANIAVWAVLPNIAVIQTLQQIKTWHQEERQIIAPDLLIAEASSVIRRCVFMRQITKDEGEQALTDLFLLGIETVPLTLELCKTAVTWASTLQHARLYDSLYLALAEQQQAELWTADKRLINGAKQHGFPRIHWIGETE